MLRLISTNQPAASQVNLETRDKFINNRDLPQTQCRPTRSVFFSVSSGDDYETTVSPQRLFSIDQKKQRRKESLI